MSELFFPPADCNSRPQRGLARRKTVIAGSRVDSEKVELEDVDDKHTGNREGSGVISLMTPNNSTPFVFNVM